MQLKNLVSYARESQFKDFLDMQDGIIISPLKLFTDRAGQSNGGLDILC